jgi:hypothetical protein
VKTIKWNYEGENGFWHSQDHRFEINPTFRHTVNPDGYRLYDNKTGQKYGYDTVRDCKSRAERLVTVK